MIATIPFRGAETTALRITALVRLVPISFDYRQRRGFMQKRRKPKRSKKPMPMCRHCKIRVANRRLGLCRPCWDQPKIRRRYKSQSKFGRRGYGLGEHVRPLPEPTDCAPGSKGKVQILIDRAKAGEQLWHPLDRKKLPPSLE